MCHYPIELLPSTCVDTQGNMRNLDESWTDPDDICVSCQCVAGGLPICYSPSCAGKPHKFCTRASDKEVCCPDWTCPRGKVPYSLGIYQFRHSKPTVDVYILGASYKIVSSPVCTRKCT